MAAFGGITTQQTITCSKSTIETLEQGVKYVQWICSNITMKAAEWHWHRSGVFFVKFEYLSQLVLVFSIVDFEQVIACYV